jgi:prepilin-type N-terminal cleavage/methylation domain-containing protein
MVSESSTRTNFRRRGFTLVELLVVIAIIGVLVALLLPAVQAAREAARRSQCENNCKNVALAVLTYESARKEMPKGMTFPKALESSIGTLSVFNANWIITVLPYLEEQALYDSFNLKRPINDPAIPLTTNRNYIARGTVISVLLCPSDANNRVMYQGYPGSGHGGNWARGNYAGNMGGAYIYAGCNTPEACASGPDSAGWKNNKYRGVMGPNTSVTVRRITDGTSRTVLLGEIRAGLTEKDARGVWAMGHAGPSLLAAYGSEGDDNGPNTCNAYADDVYSDICDKPDPNGECMECYSGGAFAQQTVRSMHKDGVYVAMCDGSVQFESDDVETSGVFGNWGSLWDRLITSADGGQPGAFNGAFQ